MMDGTLITMAGGTTRTRCSSVPSELNSENGPHLLSEPNAMPDARSLPDDSLAEFARRVKEVDRSRLEKLDPATAQAEVDRIIASRLWIPSSGQSSAWAGDLGDEPDDPVWLAQS